MLLRFLRWLFLPAPPRSQPAPAAIIGRPASFFTSDIEPTTASRHEIVDAVQARALVVTPASFRIYQEGHAMDAAGDALSSSAKGVFALPEAGVPDAQLLWYASQSFIGFQTCAILAQNWLVEKACSTPARDAARNGYKVMAAKGVEVDPELLERVKAADKAFGLKRHCVDLAKFTRVFGIRIAIFLIDSPDPKFYERPFNADGITPGSYRGIAQVDPYWCVPELSMEGASNPASPDFFEPTYWTIQGKRYHRSHLVIARGPRVADLLKPTYQYAGVSLAQRIYERVYAAERTANEAPQLALTKRSTFLYTDTGKAFAPGSAFMDKLRNWVGLRDNYGVKVLDQQGDKAEQFDTALGDFDTVLMSQYQLVAAIADMPSTRLLGTAPKGFNATGEYEEATYHEALESIQANDMEPLVNRHHICVIRSQIAPVAGVAPFSVYVEWEPLDAPTEKEEADTVMARAGADKVWIEAGAIDGQDVRNRISRDKKSGYAGIAADVPADAGPHMPGPPVPATGQATPGGGADGAFALDASDFDSVTGTYADAQLISNQTFLDPDLVAQKIVAGDFVVQLSPEFQTAAGQRYRVIIDGHHSLAAAVKSGNVPVFVEANYSGSDYCNAVTQLPAFGSEPDAA